MANENDSMWDHVFVAPNNRRSVFCKFCSQKIGKVAKKVAAHLSSTKRYGVKGCNSVPRDVFEEAVAWIADFERPRKEGKSTAAPHLFDSEARKLYRKLYQRFLKLPSDMPEIMVLEQVICFVERHLNTDESKAAPDELVA